jgi:probable F420-dependent oxidoreductase
MIRFSYAEAMCDPSYYVPLAREIEAAGYDAFVVPDNIGFPANPSAKYPYTPDGDPSFLDGKPFIEPFSLIPAMGAVTDRLRFNTFVLKLPIRLPYLVAKQVTSTAVLTNNRLGLGVGLSPWPEDFQACGQEWKTRGKRMDEMIEIIRGYATGEFFEYHGEHYDIGPMKMRPVPSKPVPILIGGHSPAALRRAARLGDGWMHAGGAQEDLLSMISKIRELRDENGRGDLPFEVHVISLDAFSVDGLLRLDDIGVTDVIVGFSNPYTPEVDTESLQSKVDKMRRYAESTMTDYRRHT